MADPLSSATRATKRNLLIASVLAISANAFNVSIDKIPVGGLSITFDDRLFAFLLLIVLFYFLCTFVLYYTIDIKNLEATTHQSDVEKSFKERLAGYPIKYSNFIFKDLRSLVPPGMQILPAPNYSHAFYSDTFIGTDGYFIVKLMSQPNIPNVGVRREDERELFARLDERHHYLISQFQKSRKADRRRALSVVITMRFTYFLRNYIFDGALPILLGIFALVTILGHIDLTWLQHYLPSFRTLSNHQITSVISPPS